MNTNNCNLESHDFLCSNDSKFIFCKRCGKVNRLDCHLNSPTLQPAVSQTQLPTEQIDESFKFYVRFLTGKTVTIENVSPQSTVLFIKREIDELERIPISEQMLIYGGRQLDDNCTLTEYNIANESTLNLILKYSSPKKSVLPEVKQVSENKEIV